MKSHRCLALSLCFASLWFSSAVVLAAQPAAKEPVEVRHEQPAKAQARQAGNQKAKAGAKASTKATRGKAVSKARKKPVSKAVSKALPKPKLDLSLPPEMVEQLEPEVDNKRPRGKPLLPTMFPEKPTVDSPFQLNGRLISNEMQLQLRNDSRRDVDGAAIEFEFKQ
ncbi:hypothetical protein G7009_22560 [Pseudomonas capeferrum]|uniref:hypothetical protein n=1 Tax=Pseudomonas capeferrum TaxID=1495066 RepID=UPI0015E356E5|nr:hypothetical protein [Pseudomonas capeferrum]MBA1204501.1 hypothetical protein [Pseudomonas capeferrum]